MFAKLGFNGLMDDVIRFYNRTRYDTVPVSYTHLTLPTILRV